ncbi:MarR family winged helix-turn-helix transcriptional regulator [Rhodococcus phenolicus]|uniref:MarR family winged helix-turn-helix transcriptional regulator n=1 Tax=Rhodococcus phenolicus TaxID=263849 RepID=UPI0008307C4F|nr:MarR family transcriptional regulator [Rhodococcus phenolicus]
MPGTEDNRHQAMVHGLRELVVQLNLFGSEFARLHGLHATDVRALIALLDAARAGTIATPGWLGRQLGLNSASTTALVDRLEKSGLISRERDAQDRRRVRLQVTESAERLGWDFFGPLIGRAVGVLDSFSPEQIAAIDEFLSRMRTVVENVRETTAAPTQ